ncbi:MAG: GerMN domain-containing protein [Candidatus Aquilonibacter sp.]|jgi:spore germination protein GerM
MKVSRVLIPIVIFAIAAAAGWYFSRPHAPTESGQTLTVYYSKLDGTTLGTWDVSLRAEQSGESAAARLHEVASYAALQSVAGPPPDIAAVRFPPGTRVRDVSVSGGTALVDLSGDVASANGGTFQENGEFKGLVYTLTGIPSINAVQITIEGRTVETLPGGHLELDAPLRRSDW